MYSLISLTDTKICEITTTSKIQNISSLLPTTPLTISSALALYPSFHPDFKNLMICLLEL